MYRWTVVFAALVLMSSCRSTTAPQLEKQAQGAYARIGDELDRKTSPRWPSIERHSFRIVGDRVVIDMRIDDKRAVEPGRGPLAAPFDGSVREPGDYWLPVILFGSATYAPRNFTGGSIGMQSGWQVQGDPINFRRVSGDDQPVEVDRHGAHVRITFPASYLDGLPAEVYGIYVWRTEVLANGEERWLDDSDSIVPYVGTIGTRGRGHGPGPEVIAASAAWRAAASAW